MGFLIVKEKNIKVEVLKEAILHVKEKYWKKHKTEFSISVITAENRYYHDAKKYDYSDIERYLSYSMIEDSDIIVVYITDKEVSAGHIFNRNVNTFPIKFSAQYGADDFLIQDFGTDCLYIENQLFTNGTYTNEFLYQNLLSERRFEYYKEKNYQAMFASSVFDNNIIVATLNGTDLFIKNRHLLSMFNGLWVNNRYFYNDFSNTSVFKEDENSLRVKIEKYDTKFVMAVKIIRSMSDFYYFQKIDDDSYNEFYIEPIKDETYYISVFNKDGSMFKERTGTYEFLKDFQVSSKRE